MKKALVPHNDLTSKAYRTTLYAGLILILAGLMASGSALIGPVIDAVALGEVDWLDISRGAGVIVGGVLLVVATLQDLFRGTRANRNPLLVIGIALVTLVSLSLLAA
jgi:hypothetical protein